MRGEQKEAAQAQLFTMTMLQQEIDNLARELQSAQETGQMVQIPLSQRPGFDLDAAYAVEAKLNAQREAAGHRAVGRKVGYANKAMWRVLKLETLVWAHMYEDTVHYSKDNFTTLAVAHARSLKIEPEIVFGMRSAVATGVADAAGALASVEWVALGFEIIDCPYPDWKFQPADFVASFGLHAALVVGEKTEVSPESILKLVNDLAQFKLRMFKGDDLIEEGSGRNSLKSPALCLAELASAIARRFPSEPLGPGELVSSGTLTAGHLTTVGDSWRVEVEGISLPALTLRIC
jgi:2-keto-4-pentenoate hydratase